MTSPTELSVTTRALLDACVRRGQKLEPILERHDLSLSEISHPDVWLPSEAVLGLWMEVLQDSADPHLALHAGAELPLGNYPVVDSLVEHSSTVGQGLTNIARFFGLISNSEFLRIDNAGPHRVMRLRSPWDPTTVPRPFAEYTMAAIIIRTRAAWSYCWRPLRVEFAGPSTGSSIEHHRLFGCPVVHNAARTQIVIDKGVWESRVRRPDVETYSMLETRARTLLGQLPNENRFTNLVREVIGESFLSGQLELAQVAKRLSISPRTLQRRLGEAGYSFGILLNEVRRDLSQRYLRWGLPISHVALQLGYSEHSAFTRAFKRWTGSTPAEYRRRARG